MHEGFAQVTHERKMHGKKKNDGAKRPQRREMRCVANVKSVGEYNNKEMCSAAKWTLAVGKRTL